MSMSFQEFLSERATSHGQVETVVRSLNLDYKTEKSDTSVTYVLKDDKRIVSYNTGKIEIIDKDKVISTIDVSDYVNTRKKLETALKECKIV